MHAKTGTAEVYGKQTTSWFATYTKDYTIVMTISQGGTGSGASGPAVRNIYDALYGVARRRHDRPEEGAAAGPAEGCRRSPTTARSVPEDRQGPGDGPAAVARGAAAAAPAQRRRPDPPRSPPGTPGDGSRMRDRRSSHDRRQQLLQSAGYSPGRARWAKLFARDSLVRRLDWPMLLAALALSGIGSLLVFSATRNRTELNHGDQYYFLIRHLMNTGIGLALCSARSGSATAPARRPCRSSTALSVFLHPRWCSPRWAPPSTAPTPGSCSAAASRSSPPSS